MTIAFDAVYEDGVFRPTGPVDLPAGAAVRLTVVPVPSPAPAAGGRAIRDILAAITARSVKPAPPETTAADHDRILYGDRGNPDDVR